MTTLEVPSVIGDVRSMQVGRAAPLGDGVMSAFVKRPVTGPVAVHKLGLEGDEQVDLRVHGGPEKALYGYAWSNYWAWRVEFPQHESLLTPGGFGENLTIAGCDESQVCLGDVVRIGTARLQVSQPRQPCFKFALRFDDVAMPRAMMQNGRSGWYYRVLTTGLLAPGDSVVLERRPGPDWPIARVNRLITQRRASDAEKADYAAVVTHITAERGNIA